MTIDDLRAELAAILTIEEGQSPDWQEIEASCLALVGRLVAESEPSYPHEIVYHFLDDVDVRRKDGRYADQQRDKLRHWLHTL
jgi:hypothetical protein